MVTIANPIYDIVFKYLLEDERIARIILSALLKKEVLSVETQRKLHGYAIFPPISLSVRKKFVSLSK